MRTFSEDLLESLSDDELLRGQGELARLVHAREAAKAEAARLERGLEPNKAGQLVMNKKTMEAMGRDLKGAPLPPKIKR